MFTSHIILYYSATTGKIIEKASMPDQRLCSATTTTSVNNSIDLLESVQWQLEWSTYRQSMFQGMTSSANNNISLILQCIPKPEFTNEMGDVWVTIGLTLYSGEPDNGEVIYDVPSDKVLPIRLTKQAQYQCVLIRDPYIQSRFIDPILASVGNSHYKNSPYPHSIQLSRFGTHISAKVIIVNVGCPMRDSLRDDFEALLKTGGNNRFSDITLVASHKGTGIKKRDSRSTPVEFPAHKVILAARSPVFASMFEHNMQESSNNKVEIDDICPDALKIMLVYIYTGRVPNVDDVAYDLLYASDKYQLDHLKALCEQQLSKNLKVENAAQIIQLAHMHNAPVLKENTLRFISNHGAEVRATKEWEEVKQCPEILDEIIRVMSEPASKKAKK